MIYIIYQKREERVKMTPEFLAQFIKQMSVFE